MPDGARLGARLWLPDRAPDRPAPAILEYIPYRKDDYTAIRDSTTIAWFATRGYACIRVDMRGSGSSDGIMPDEYSEQEIEDGVATIEWIAKQDWCDGNVGTIGISWGGITGLQLAQRGPRPLKTVIALGASEYRYYDDAGYYMGCMVGQTIGWAAIMFGYNTRPPDPMRVGEGWRQRWLDRLQNTPHYLEHWLSHQREDEYWLRGTVGRDYGAIRIPVYAVSGHADCWPNTVSRLLERLSVPRRGLQGAWCHRYPHLGIPGPTVGFLDDAARWFDRWLKGSDNGIMEESIYQVYIQDSVRPAPFYETRPGRWVGEPAWPSPRVRTTGYFLGDGELTAERPERSTVLEICSPQSVGLAGGEYMPWFSFGPAAELPDDQRDEDAGSLVFDTSALTEKIQILGNPEVELVLASDQPQALVAVRLCDLWPDGASTLITRGILNLCQRNSKRDPERLVAGKQYTVRLSLNHVGYSVPPGHRLRLAVSTSYWPIAWPSPRAATISVFTGSSRCFLPTRIPDADDGELTQFEPTQTGRPVATTMLRKFSQNRTITTDDADMHVFEILTDNGKVRFDEGQLEMGSRSLQRCSIKTDDPLSAKAEYEWEWEYSRGGAWRVRTLTRTTMTCDEDDFFVVAESVAWESDAEVFRKSWNKSYPRDHF